MRGAVAGFTGLQMKSSVAAKLLHLVAQGGPADEALKDPAVT